MDILIKKSVLAGAIAAPPSKSLTHRYLVLAALKSGKTTINNPLICADTLRTIDALERLGVKIKRRRRAITVHGTGGKFTAKNAKLFLGDSGTSLRLILGVAALCKNPVFIDGSKRLRERPHAKLLKILEQQGAKIQYLKNRRHAVRPERSGRAQALQINAPFCVSSNEVKAHHSIPLIISSNGIKGGEVAVPGNISSQFISSLLMIAPFARKKLKIKITGRAVSKGYIALTLNAIRKVKNSSLITVEGDFSSASYFMALSLLTGAKIRIKNLNKKSVQPDGIISDILEKPLNNAEINISNCPDIALTLGILGPKFGITLIGVKRLADKESDRA
ncbi:hypothetical protein HZA39_02505, partial [Candidatus Peregrinibacteria bacterium]|nr:hypothetical protein [Candidatus Peregrinibacteria bacterium]